MSLRIIKLDPHGGNMKTQIVKMKDFCQFFDDTGISAEGGNHPLFISIFIGIYGFGIYLAINYQIVLGLAIVLIVFYFVQIPFRYSFWYPMSRHLNLYRYHRKYSLLGLDFYIINEILFCPKGKMRENVDAKFQMLKEFLDGKSC